VNAHHLVVARVRLLRASFTSQPAPRASAAFRGDMAIELARRAKAARAQARYLRQTKPAPAQATKLCRNRRANVVRPFPTPPFSQKAVADRTGQLA
jgi:hypothetical protein